MRVAATVVQDHPIVRNPPTLTIVCCGQARVCSLCERLVCFEHDDATPVTCEVLDVVCSDCHQTCTSISCAREHADHDLWK